MSEDERTASIPEELLYSFVTEDSVRKLQAPYVKFFTQRSCRTVLDLGAGRGVFMALLSEAGLKPSGVDMSPLAAQVCRERGQDDVAVAEALDFLHQARDAGRRWDGLFCSHVIEHMPPGEAMALLRACAEVVPPGGPLVLITPNVENLEVMSKTFWLDPTHVRPYPRPLLGVMLQAASFRVAASLVDPRSRIPYLSSHIVNLVPDLLRYGLSAFAGKDAIVVGERAG